MNLQTILTVGAAPNTDLNTTVASALKMKEYFTKLLAGTAAMVGSVLINTTIATPEEAHLIPIQTVPDLPIDAKLYLHLEVFSPALGDQTKWSVVSWERAVRFRGLDMATRDYLAMVLPGVAYTDLPVMLAALTEKLVELNG